MNRKNLTAAVLAGLLALAGVFGIVGSAQATGLVFVPVIQDCHTGSWYDPDYVGEGINLEVLDDIVVGYFYRPGGKWFTMIGDRPDIGEKFELTIYQTLDFGDTRKNGKAHITIVDNDNLVFDYKVEWNFDTNKWCLGCSGSFPYVRITQPISCD